MFSKIIILLVLLQQFYIPFLFMKYFNVQGLQYWRIKGTLYECCEKLHTLFKCKHDLLDLDYN